MKKQKRESEEGGEKEDGVEKRNKDSLKTTSLETSKRYKCLKE